MDKFAAHRPEERHRMKYQEEPQPTPSLAEQFHAIASDLLYDSGELDKTEGIQVFIDTLITRLLSLRLEQRAEKQEHPDLLYISEDAAEHVGQDYERGGWVKTVQSGEVKK